MAVSVRRSRFGLRRRDESRSGFAGWPDGCRAAISLTFDDARRSQLENGLPLFDRLGVAVTLFVLPRIVAEAPAAWREAVAAGHEIGNHSLTHPCSGNFVWSRENALERMTLADYRRELSTAGHEIDDLLGVEPAVFAYPCGQTFVGRGASTRSLVPLVAEMFVAGRTFNDAITNAPLEFDPAQVACINSDRMTFDDLLPTLETAVDAGGWLVLGGHEIADSRAHDATSTAFLRDVISWCRVHDVWIDTVGTVARVAA